MITHVDGTRFNGNLAKGQIWVKGNREKTIVYFNGHTMKYQTKKDIKNGTVTTVKRSSFRDWVTTGAMLKDKPS